MQSLCAASVLQTTVRALKVVERRLFFYSPPAEPDELGCSLKLRGLEMIVNCGGYEAAEVKSSFPSFGWKAISSSPSQTDSGGSLFIARRFWTSRRLFV